MTDRREYEATMLAHLGWAQNAMATVCRRYGTAPSDVEEFVSWATCKLLEDDYAVLRKFRGGSSLRTYLAVVIAMLNREYHVKQWGRWRPSAAARRAGEVAVRLERLVYRDGYALAHAINRMRINGETALTERQLTALFRALPTRQPGRGRAAEIPDAFGDVADPAGADDPVLAREAADERRRVEHALGRALAALPPEDQLIVRMRYWEGLSIADVARALGLPQKPLYRRLEGCLARLRRSLEAAGLSPRHAAACLAERVA